MIMRSCSSIRIGRRRPGTCHERICHTPILHIQGMCTYMHIQEMCIYACIHIHIHTYIHTYMHACIHTYICNILHIYYYNVGSQASCRKALCSAPGCLAPSSVLSAREKQYITWESLRIRESPLELAIMSYPWESIIHMYVTMNIIHVIYVYIRCMYIYIHYLHIHMCVYMYIYTYTHTGPADGCRDRAGRGEAQDHAGPGKTTWYNIIMYSNKLWYSIPYYTII